MANIALIDTSWLMHKNFHALSMLSVTKQTPLGTTVIPTGHVYGTYQDICNLSKHYDAVIMCLDSIRHERKEILSQYKAGRHEDGGYNIYNDLINIVTLCTGLPNVYYCKVPEYETDDILATFIQYSNVAENKSYTLYHNDNDILITPGNYLWCNKIAGAPIDRLGYISAKYLNEKSPLYYDYLPLWVKVVRGDSSDKIPAGIPRFPADKLKELVDKIPQSQDFEEFLSTLKLLNLSSAWKARIAPAFDKESDMYKQLYTNYRVVKPAYLPDIKQLVFKKYSSTIEQRQRIFDYYEIQA